jgi:hypothetical protein
MHESSMIPTVNMMYTGSQNYTYNMVVDENEIQSFGVVDVVLVLLLLSFVVFCPCKCTFLMTFGQMICLNILNMPIHLVYPRTFVRIVIEENLQGTVKGSHPYPYI